MKIKTIVTGILLLFVGISIAYLVVGESQSDQTTVEIPTESVIQTVQEKSVNDDAPQKFEAPEHGEKPAKPAIQTVQEKSVNADAPQKPKALEQREKPAEPTAETIQEVVENDKASQMPHELDRKVIAYYFHGTQRCVTCRKIEAYTEESLRTAFSSELEAGQLEWRPVNVDNAANEHFIQDYELSTRSVVLVEMLDGEQKQWKNLARVWELVRDKPSFVAYVQEEAIILLGD